MGADFLNEKRAHLKLGEYDRHVLICGGPRCCNAEDGDAAYEALKDQIKASGAEGCYRTRVHCLRVCGEGPVGVVYPEGTWYHGLTAERIPLFVERHLVQGRPVEEWIFARNPLPRCSESPAH